ncbi:hypothetical protein DFH29DRAFT_878048 [Suillus ampliporus]|nr:hypothetical protein DFH29DRAFT_878048 [Suillus ampliporus]
MPSPTQDVIPQLDLGNTFGALVIGAILATILFGVTNVQAFIYFQTHRGTGMTFYKLAVILLWILDAFHFVLMVHGIYYYLVTNYANVAALPELVWSTKLQIPIDTLIIWGVHLLYVHRMWIGICSPTNAFATTNAMNIVSRGRSRALPITVGIVVVLGIAITLNWAVYQCHTFTDLLAIEWANYSTLGTLGFLDILIASSLSYLLATSRTGFASTDCFVTKLMGYTIGTGCVTSKDPIVVISISSLRVFDIYVNSYIALLNTRYYLQGNADNIDSSEFHNGYGVYRPELCIGASQDENLRAPRKNVFKQPDHEVVHPTRPAQAAMVGSRVIVHGSELNDMVCHSDRLR